MMRKIKLGRALGLSLLSALCLVAVFAASAQAGEAQEGAFSELVPGRNLTVNCQNGVMANGAIETEVLAVTN
jgi:hypothetical protein